MLALSPIGSGTAYADRYATCIIFENVIKFKRCGSRPLPTRGVRGDAVGFSASSRRRMISKLNELRWPDTSCHFVTLTYPDAFPGDWQAVKRDLSRIKKRMKRRYDGLGVFWRVELVPRQTGLNRGKIAPHFHLIIFGAPTGFEKILTEQWHAVAGAGDPNHLIYGTDVKQVNDRRMAQWYISKYMSKDDSIELIKFGRIWGYYGRLDFAPTFGFALPRNLFEQFRMLIIDFLGSINKLRSAEYLTQLAPWSGFQLFNLGSAAETWPGFLACFEKLKAYQPSFELIYTSTLYTWAEWLQSHEIDTTLPERGGSLGRSNRLTAHRVPEGDQQYSYA